MKAIPAASYTTSWTCLVFHTASAPQQNGRKKNGSSLSWFTWLHTTKQRANRPRKTVQTKSFTGRIDLKTPRRETEFRWSEQRRPGHTHCGAPLPCAGALVPNGSEHLHLTRRWAPGQHCLKKPREMSCKGVNRRSQYCKERDVWKLQGARNRSGVCRTGSVL